MADAAASFAPTAAAAIRVIASIVLALAVPVVLIGTGVRWVTLSQSFYLAEFAKYGVASVTRLGPDELTSVAQAFGDYFQSPQGRLDVAVNLPEGRQQLLNEREIEHMMDVQLLVHRVFWLWGSAIVVSVLCLIAALATDPVTGARAIARGLAGGGVATVALVGLAGLAAVVDFQRVFLQFHFVSFTNDLWLLDPRRDRLIQLFPQGFFFDAALRIAAFSIVLGATVTGLSLAVLRVLRGGVGSLD